VSELVPAVFQPGRTGSPSGPAGLVVRERKGTAIIGVQARRAQAAALAATVWRDFEIDLPTSPCVASGRGMSFVWSGPGRWLALARESPEQFQGQLQHALGRVCAICDQSDGRILLDLSGPRVLETLAKGVPVDLHPSRFPPGAVALTVASHVGVQLWRSQFETETYHLLIARSYFGSFWSWLAASAAEFGCEVE
jgi:sarcosine oxidase subunit gamma